MLLMQVSAKLYILQVIIDLWLLLHKVQTPM